MYDKVETGMMSHFADSDQEHMASSKEGLISTELTLDAISNHDEYWAEDTGSTTYVTKSSTGIYNCIYPTKPKKGVTGNGTKTASKKVGTLKG